MFVMSHRNQTIEYFRTIACILIVLIHARFPEPVGLWIIGAGRFSVPFFCIISGYYCMKNDTEASLLHIRTHLKKIVILTLFASALAVITNCIAGLITGDGCFTWIVKELHVKVLLRFLLFNRAVFLNSAIWYLFAMIYAYGFLYFLVKTGIIRYGLPVAFVLLTMNLIACEFSGHVWYYGGNFLFEVLPFVVIGYHFDKILTIRIPLNLQIFLAGIGCALAMWEITVFSSDAPLYIGSVICAIMVFRICLEKPSDRAGFISTIGTKLTMPIYILHCCVCRILLAIWPALPGTYQYPLLVLFATILLALPYALFTSPRTFAIRRGN